MGIELHYPFTDKAEGIIPYLDTLPWDTTLKRRTQQYGARYDFRSSKLHVAPSLPTALALQLGDVTFTQCIVNEYVGKQGIGKHIDAPCFGPVIAILSLGDPCRMVFRRGKEKHSILLPHNSLLVLSGEERYEWTHEISGQTFHRRVSLTYRTI